MLARGISCFILLATVVVVACFALLLTISAIYGDDSQEQWTAAMIVAPLGLLVLFVALVISISFTFSQSPRGDVDPGSSIPMKKAKTISIKSWPDPQGDIVLIYCKYECSIYFGCWVAPGEPADYIGCLSFQQADAVRSFPREFCPYGCPNATCPSILSIPDSDMLSELTNYRQKYYPTSRFDPSQYTHFVISGHDIYHEIVATGFTETTIHLVEVTKTGPPEPLVWSLLKGSDYERQALHDGAEDSDRA